MARYQAQWLARAGRPSHPNFVSETHKQLRREPCPRVRYDLSKATDQRGRCDDPPRWHINQDVLQRESVQKEASYLLVLVLVHTCSEPHSHWTTHPLAINWLLCCWVRVAGEWCCHSLHHFSTCLDAGWTYGMVVRILKCVVCLLYLGKCFKNKVVWIFCFLCFVYVWTFEWLGSLNEL